MNYLILIILIEFELSKSFRFRIIEPILK